MRRVPVIERHAQLPARSLDRVEYIQAFFRIDGHGFLRDHITAELHRMDDVLVMGAVNRTYENDVRFPLPDHPIEVFRFIGWNRGITVLVSQQLVRIIHTRLVDVADGDQFRSFLISRSQRAVKELRSTACSYDRVSLFSQDHPSIYMNLDLSYSI
ncbi:hypothetical protein D1872_246930 [compost metagenome]